MSSLVPCHDCGRHAKLEEARCPFCGGTLPREVRRPRVVRKITRAVLFLGGATLAACSTSEPEPAPEPAAVIDMTPMQPVPIDVASPEPPPLPPIEPVAVVAESPEEARAERAHAERRKRRRRGGPVPIGPSCCPPYGAPPADLDIV